MDTDRYMNILRSISIARPDLFPLDADELDEIETKAEREPNSMTDNELFLLAVANLYGILWNIYDERDPENGDEQFHKEMFNLNRKED